MCSSRCTNHTDAPVHLLRWCSRLSRCAAAHMQSSPSRQWTRRTSSAAARKPPQVPSMSCASVVHHGQLFHAAVHTLRTLTHVMHHSMLDDQAARYQGRSPTSSELWNACISAWVQALYRQSLGSSNRLAWYGAHACRGKATRRLTIDQRCNNITLARCHAGKLMKWSLGNKELICMRQFAKQSQGDQLLSGSGHISPLTKPQCKAARGVLAD